MATKASVLAEAS